LKSEGILSALTPAAEIAAPRGRVALPELSKGKKVPAYEEGSLFPVPGGDE